MSMSTSSSTSSPLANLSLSDSRCNNDSCLAFKAAHAASQAEVSYYWQYEYGHWTTWYYIILIGLFAILNASRLWREHRKSSIEGTNPSVTFFDKARALRRSISYRRLRGPVFDHLGLPSIGVLLFLSAALIFFLVATFAVQPYYRGHRGYGSPPLAVRTGLMAVACTPILIALAGKANIITLLTGYGYEKLNIVHRYVAWMCFGLSVAHTIPFIIAPLNDGGYVALQAQFYKPGAFEYTGVPPLAMLFGLVLFSIPWIRHRFYETFWHVHILLALAYVGLMFWHAGQEQDSWAYLWATLAILLSSTLVRIFHLNRVFNIHAQWLQGSPASLTSLADDAIRVEVLAPEGFTWRPGQHCYLRLPSLRPWDNHPFTIANVLQAPSGNDTQIISFLIRKRNGFTNALHKLASSRPDTTFTAWLDGPYGGFHYSLEHTYDDLILLAAGGGISACLPWFQAVAKAKAEGHSCLKHVSLIWIVRQREHVTWAEADIRMVLDDTNGETMNAAIYVTGDEKVHVEQPVIQQAITPDLGKQFEVAKTAELSGLSEGKMMLKPATINMHQGRPPLGELLPNLLGTRRNFVLACGPESLKIDASNACALAQQRVLNGSMQEVKIHTESFGW